MLAVSGGEKQGVVDRVGIRQAQQTVCMGCDTVSMEVKSEGAMARS